MRERGREDGDGDQERPRPAGKNGTPPPRRRNVVPLHGHTDLPAWLHLPHQTTVITGPVYANQITTGTHYAACAEAERVERLLLRVLERLDDSGLPRSSEEAVREATGTALQEARQETPHPRRLRRRVHEVAEALLAGMADGAGSEAVKGLLLLLQHAL